MKSGIGVLFQLQPADPGSPHFRGLCHCQDVAQVYLKVRRAKQKGGAMDKLKEKDPVSLQSSLVCLECSMLWTGGPNCLRVIEVDGAIWEFRFSGSGPF